MKIIHNEELVQSKTRIIKDSICGYWENDKWDFKSEIFERYNPKGIDICGCFDFTEFEMYIKEEIKYFLICKMENSILTMGTMSQNSSSINLINEFLTEYYQNISSFTEISIEKGMMQWRIFLIEKEYKINNKGQISNIMTRNFLSKIIRFFESFYDTRTEYEKDIWDIRNINKSKIPIAQSKYTLNFNGVPECFKDLLKRYIKVNIVRYSIGYCESKIINLRLFFNFIYNKHREWNELKYLSRKDIEDFILCIVEQNEENHTYNTQYKIHDAFLILKHFIEFIQMSEYPEAPIKSVSLLIFKEDIPKKPNWDVDNTKYIPEEVLSQLEENIQYVKPIECIPILIILRATGMRISDVLNLRYDKCLDATKQGWYLIFDIIKTKVMNHRIPITAELALIIKQQIKETIDISINDINPRKFLFVKTTGVRAGMPPSSRTIERALNRLASNKNIVDGDGNIFHFHNHAFRHTKAVELINNGMNLVHVQKWLAHCSPEMTLKYAQLLDTTMRKSWEDVMKKGIFKVNIESGKLQKIDVQDNNLIEWEYIRHNLDAVRIPLGFCLKPSKIQCNNQLNPCLLCSNMCTSPEFLHEFEEEINATRKQIEMSKIFGRSIWAEKNQTVLDRLEAIVTVLKDGKVYHKAGKYSREYIGDERSHAKYN